MKPRVLILNGPFWPGHDSAGPNLSIRAMCRALADRFDFFLVARDRPFTGGSALAKPNVWQDRDGYRIAYLPTGRRGAKGLTRLLRETPHDVLILSSFFDPAFTIAALVARRLRRVPRTPLILSPRGEFSDGALGLKHVRKSVYRAAARALGLISDATIHVTSEAELHDVTRRMPAARIARVDNARPLFALPPHRPRADGTPLRVAFLGRISRVKGLDIALNALGRVKAAVDFDIFGPISDPRYWAECEALIANLPAHVRARWAGEIGNDAVPAELGARDLLLLPSLSENFGHAIFEALAAGTPVAIGDRTPWRGLELKCAGFDLPTGDPFAFAAAIDRFAGFGREEAARWRAGARSVAEMHVGNSTANADMAALLTRLIGETPR